MACVTKYSLALCPQELLKAGLRLLVSNVRWGKGDGEREKEKGKREMIK